MHTSTLMIRLLILRSQLCVAHRLLYVTFDAYEGIVSAGGVKNWTRIWGQDRLNECIGNVYWYKFGSFRLALKEPNNVLTFKPRTQNPVVKNYRLNASAWCARENGIELAFSSPLGAFCQIALIKLFSGYSCRTDIAEAACDRRKFSVRIDYQ